MQKPFSSLNEHLLYILETEGPKRVKDLVKITGKSSGHVSGSLIRTRSRISDLLWKNRDTTWSLSITAEEAFKLYNESKNTKRKIIKMPNPALVTPEETLLETTPLESFKGIVETFGKDLNIKITIEGSVKITFAIEK